MTFIITYEHFAKVSGVAVWVSHQLLPIESEPERDRTIANLKLNKNVRNVGWKESE